MPWATFWLDQIGIPKPSQTLMTHLFNLGYPSTEYKSDRFGYRGTSLQDFYARFPDDEACLRHVFAMRYGDGIECPKCERPGRWYRIRGTRRFQHPCGQNIWPLTGTVFERTHIPLQIWFYAMLHFANSSSGVTTTFLGRQLGVSHKAAYRLADRLRMHMAAIDRDKSVGRPGEPVEVRIETLDGVHTAGHPLRGAAKAVIIGDSESVQTTLIGRPRRHVLRAIIKDKAAAGAVPVTSCKCTYRVLEEFGTRTPSVRLVDDFVDPCSLVSPAKSFLNHMRKPMSNTYRRVGYANLWKYLKEFEFRYNRRHCSHRIFRELTDHFPDLSAQSREDLEAWSSRAQLQRSRDK